MSDHNPLIVRTDLDQKIGSQPFCFECMTAKYIWSLLAFSLGADCRPSNLDQCWFWIDKILPQGAVMHTVGLAAVCWAIWRSRNAVCFENKRVKSPTEIVCMICSFLTYWAGLLTEEWKHQAAQGAEAVKTAAIFFHRQNVQSCAQEEHQLVP